MGICLNASLKAHDSGCQLHRQVLVARLSVSVLRRLRAQKGHWVLAQSTEGPLGPSSAIIVSYERLVFSDHEMKQTMICNRAESEVADTAGPPDIDPRDMCSSISAKLHQNKVRKLI